MQLPILALNLLMNLGFKAQWNLLPGMVKSGLAGFEMRDLNFGHKMKGDGANIQILCWPLWTGKELPGRQELTATHFYWPITVTGKATPSERWPSITVTGRVETNCEHWPN